MFYIIKMLLASIEPFQHERQCGGQGFRKLLLILAIAWTAQVAWGQKRPAPHKPPSIAPHFVLTGKPSDYVKSIHECEHCHRPETLEFEMTPHASIQLPKGAMAIFFHGSPVHPIDSCAACHGPDKAHTVAEEAAGSNVAKEKAAGKLIFGFHGTPTENSEHCLVCHITSAHQQFFNEAVHALRGVSCLDCHAAHLVEALVYAKAKIAQAAQEQFFSVPRLTVQEAWLHDGQLLEPEPDLCYKCHSDVEAQYALPFHMPVPEGLMKCTSCHAPHGTLTAFHQLNEPDFQACVKCHIEVGGPFVYEHPAVKIIGCMGCHTPHGSPNHFMLVRRETRFVCLQCHTGFHGQAVVPHGPTGLSFEEAGDCTRCHIAIHGSNSNPIFTTP